MAPRILLTAYEPYGPFPSNASLACLDALRGSFHDWGAVEVEVYPVEFDPVRERISAAWGRGIDAAVHLGQAPTSAQVRLERQAVNRGRDPYARDAQGEPLGLQPLDPGGPEHRQCGWPLEAWAEAARSAGLPCEVSHDAGTYLCNAALFWSLHEAERHGRAGQALFVHLPLTLEQSAAMHLEATRAAQEKAAVQQAADAEASGTTPEPPPVRRPHLDPQTTAAVVQRVLAELLRRGDVV